MTQICFRERPPFSPTIDLIQELRQVLIDDPESESESSSDHVRPAPAMLPIISGTGEGANGTGMIEEKAAIRKDVKDISTLYPGKWLNDVIINDYGDLIVERSQKANTFTDARAREGNLNVLNVHFFNTFFWSTLTTLGYEGGRLDKWTTNFKVAVDIFAKDVVLIPINHENKHWTAAAINFRRKRIEAYDSLGSPKDYVYQVCFIYSLQKRSPILIEALSPSTYGHIWTRNTNIRRKHHSTSQTGQTIL